MPEIKPFRALRYELEAVGDLGLVTSPPYDVVDPAGQAELLACHPRNVIRLDLPAAELGDEADDRYRRAARTFAAWRSDGTFHKDPRPSLYVYEQTYAVPGTTVEHTQRGFFARLRLEPFEAGTILPHERTLTAPKEDRYKLLRATGANMSPVVALFDDPDRRAAAVLARVANGEVGRLAADVTDGDGVRHRMWILPAAAAGDDVTVDPSLATLTAVAGALPITIADGHHRYETALRYRDERRMSRSCEEDPAFDYILTLFLATSEPLTVLPTHRIALGLGDDGTTALLASIGDWFEASPVEGPSALLDAFGPAAQAADPRAGGRGRFGLWTRSGGAILSARPRAFEAALPPGGSAVRGLDVVRLQVVLERLAGMDGASIAAGRVRYTKSASEAIEEVERAVDGADAAFLLEGTPVADIVAVAAAGDVMPQKSTYFFPKALSGLLINPHEW
ncbi:MAG: DUF1015 domain-containing protein [Candidatus Limnocylindrales bacterium]